MWCRRSVEPVDPAGLRSWLKGRLPDYLVPSVFVVLGRLPLTGSGKVDRRALPVPDVRVAQRAYVPPRSGAERVLAGIWAELLGAGQVGIEDNFFELGGDSILSIQVVSRARQAGLALSSKDIFVYQSIAELAAAGVLGQAAAPAAGAPEVAGPAPLAPIQRWFTQTGPGDLGHFTMSVLAELDPAAGPEVLAGAVEAVVAHHEGLRMRFRRDGGGWVQEVAPAGTAAVCDRRDLSGLAAGAQDAAMEQAAAAAQAGLDITAGPLVRAVLFMLGAGRAPRLFITVHHLVVDGVSWRILLGDLETACRQLRAGQPAGLEPVATSYRQWARALAGQVRAGAFDDDLDYWARVPGTVPAALPPGRDGAGPTSQDRASQDRASQDRASQDRASQDRASQDRAARTGSTRSGGPPPSPCGWASRRPMRCCTRCPGSTGPRSTTCCWRRWAGRSPTGPAGTGCWSRWKATAAKRSPAAWTCPGRWGGSPPSSRSRCTCPPPRARARPRTGARR